MVNNNEDYSNDVKMLNAALNLEHLAIAAYAYAMEKGLLSEDVVKVAKTFQAHHGQHTKKLHERIEKLGGKPITALSNEEYTKQLPCDKFTDQEAVIRYALKIEKEAAIAYLGFVPELLCRHTAQLSSSISGDEAMHWAALRSALGLFPVHISFIPLSADEVED